MKSRSTYNLKIDTISTYDIPLDRLFLKLWNGIRHVMPSTDRKLELKEKTLMAQSAWQAFVYANGLKKGDSFLKHNSWSLPYCGSPSSFWHGPFLPHILTAGLHLGPLPSTAISSTLTCPPLLIGVGNCEPDLYLHKYPSNLVPVILPAFTANEDGTDRMFCNVST